MKEKESAGVWCIDLGPNAECLVCKNRYCTCNERRNGTWENTLPAKKILIQEEGGKMKKYMVNLYYSTFLSAQIDAKNKSDAIKIARIKYGYGKDGKGDELLSNLEEWREGDTVESTEEEIK